jgi:hypothetical protein
MVDFQHVSISVGSYFFVIIHMYFWSFFHALFSYEFFLPAWVRHSLLCWAHPLLMWDLTWFYPGIRPCLVQNLSNQIFWPRRSEAATWWRSTSCGQLVFDVLVFTFSSPFPDKVGLLLLFDMSLGCDSPQQVLTISFEYGGISEICWLDSTTIAVGTTQGRIVIFSIKNELVRFIVHIAYIACLIHSCRGNWQRFQASRHMAMEPLRLRSKVWIIAKSHSVLLLWQRGGECAPLGGIRQRWNPKCSLWLVVLRFNTGKLTAEGAT